MDENQNRKEQKGGSNSKFCTFVFQVILQGFIGYVALKVSTNPSYFGDITKCVELRCWTHKLAIFIFYILGWDIICMTLILINECFSLEKISKMLVKFNNIIGPFIFLSYTVCFIMLTFFLFLNEDCGKCKWFVLILIVLFWLSIIIFFINLSSSITFIIDAMKRLYHQRFGNSNISNNNLHQSLN